MNPSLAEQIESAWDSLTDQRKPRTFYLTDDVGTFTASVSLADFREAVFFVYEQTWRAKR